MPWKMNGEAIEVQNGNPVWIHEDGKEAPFDAARALTKIPELQTEAKGYREKLEELERKWKALPDAVTSDPEKAIKDLEIARNLADKKLIDAGQVDTVKAEAQRALKEQLEQHKAEYDGKLQASQGVIRKLTIGNQFATSKLFNGDDAVFILPPHVAESHFGRFLDVEPDGTFVAYYDEAKKQPIYSRERPGEKAAFDEAILAIADKDPGKDRITRASGSGGSGAPAPAAGGKAGSKSMARSAFNALPANEQMSFIKDGGQLTG